MEFVLPSVLYGAYNGAVWDVQGCVCLFRGVLCEFIALGRVDVYVMAYGLGRE